MGIASTWLRRIAGVVPVMLGVAALDWALNAGALAAGLHTAEHARDLPWKLIVLILVVNFGWFTFYATTPLFRLGIGIWFGGALANFGELAVRGHVTNFIPFPAGYIASPADVCVIAGLLLRAVPLASWPRGVRGSRRQCEEEEACAGCSRP